MDGEVTSDVKEGERKMAEDIGRVKNRSKEIEKQRKLIWRERREINQQ